ncbi:MAG: hypothetical protein HZB44_03785 [Actinobacteria bacterium]|nr:hypothetical protein [Actinomycetota bacterium]
MSVDRISRKIALNQYQDVFMHLYASFNDWRGNDISPGYREAIDMFLESDKFNFVGITTEDIFKAFKGEPDRYEAIPPAIKKNFSLPERLPVNYGGHPRPRIKARAVRKRP